MKITLKKLFLIYFRVGAFTFGGGYAMIPVFKRELVECHSLMASDEFYDTLAICQSIPGALAVNFAVYTGLRLRGIKGAITTMLAVTLPSFVLILTIATLLFNYVEHPIVIAFFKGVRLSVVALMIVAGMNLMIRYKSTFGIVMMLKLRVISSV
ncbi:MAG: chromate transporter [Candidatus Izimaplasma sp.]|nr:chromate transporter [Candidatus Izimaplasma bacterium]